MQDIIQSIEPLPNNAYPVTITVAGVWPTESPRGLIRAMQFEGLLGTGGEEKTSTHRWEITPALEGSCLRIQLDQYFANFSGQYDKNRTIRDVMGQHISAIFTHIEQQARRPRVQKALKAVTQIEVGFGATVRQDNRLNELIQAFTTNEHVVRMFRAPNWQWQNGAASAISRLAYPTQAPLPSDFVLLAHACRLRSPGVRSHGVLCFSVLDEHYDHQWEFHSKYGQAGLNIFLDETMLAINSAPIIDAHVNALIGSVNNLRTIYGPDIIPNWQDIEEVTFHIPQDDQADFVCATLSQGKDLRKLFQDPDVGCTVTPSHSSEKPFGDEWVFQLTGREYRPQSFGHLP